MKSSIAATLAGNTLCWYETSKSEPKYVAIAQDAQSVGVCYGRNGDGLPSEQDVVTLYRNNDITKMRIYDPHQQTLQALKGTNIELMLGIPNDALQSLNDQKMANIWVRENIRNYPDVNFKYIAAGNEVSPRNENSQYINFVLPKMQNILNALIAAGLDNQIKVSTETYIGLLVNSSPTSAGAFYDNVRGFIEPIIRFLAQNNLPMLANTYPYFGYLNDPNSNLPYALFTALGTVVTDNGRQYYNLFSAILDSHYAAQAPLGGENVEIVVLESGWPSEGGREVTIGNAGTYYANLIPNFHKGTSGTPQGSLEDLLRRIYLQCLMKIGNPNMKRRNILDCFRRIDNESTSWISKTMNYI